MAVRISGRADQTVRNSLPCAQSAVAPAFFEHSYDNRMTYRGRAASSSLSQEHGLVVRGHSRLRVLS
jgi:hypothetical protein